MPAAVSLAVVAVVTAILWCLGLTRISPLDPLSFYVLPIIVVAIIYGQWPAWLAVIAACECADFFLYSPLYSFDLPSRAEFGDLVCFSLLALIGAKCVAELFRPGARVTSSRLRRF